MKSLSTGKIWLFAAGQFGWSLLSGLISNWLVYFYQPDEASIAQGQTIFIPQGLVVLGIFTVIGGITAFGRLFDAITDPWIASLSDRCTSEKGRRIPFLKWASLPLAISTVLVFWSPVNENSQLNAVFLFVMVMAYYLSITAYCTPYNALIPELGHNQTERLNISTVISFTFIAGTAVAYLAPVIWGLFIPAFGRVNAVRITFAIMAVIAFVCMQIPVWSIHEKDYVNTVPSKDTAFSSLASTFKNGEFRKFVGSDILYWIAITMFQTGLPFFVTSLLKLPETMTTLYFVGMTGLSLVFYIPINKLAPKFGKRKLILGAFGIFALSYLYTGFLGKISVISPNVQGLILMVTASLPMAVFGILPQAVVADIAQSDAKRTGSNREGMFYAARTFAFKLGQSLSMLLFTAISTIGGTAGTGYRIAAFLAAAFCLLGGILFLFYNENKINQDIL
ncbi:MAG: MFS transporter [Lachnospiraceae bacterium]|nr:MFS transporter [Lachnospiraceae bacterium]MCX4318895.1 MFS transporter [Lachnospiraceae bacterium]MDE6904113.1 MFS transporter [Lachnospiraceae bacterium]